MSSIESKDLGTPDDVRSFPHGRFEIFRVGGQTFGRARYEPGWHWKDDVGPAVGSEWCQVHHVGVALSGKLGLRLSDGTETELESGRAYSIPPGHDGWVIGDEPWETIDYLGPAS